MRHYPSFENQKFDHILDGEVVWAENKLDGQNFVARYNGKTKEFIAFGSKRMMVDETHPQFGDAVKIFKQQYEDVLKNCIKEHSKKKQIFNSVNEIHFYFEYWGGNSFCGFHQEGDEMNLTLIDCWLKQKGYLIPKDFYETFGKYDAIKLPEIIYKGKLDNDFIQSIINNDWTKDDCLYPTVKEGVVCKRSTSLSGQRLPMVKVKTNWWMNKLKEKYPNEWEELS